jgi:hypothetical protein
LPSTSCFFVSRGRTTYFIERPAQLLADRSAHRGERHPHAPSLYPQPQWCPRVASSFSSSGFHSACFFSEVARMRRLRPVEGLGSRSSPSRRRLTRRWMVEVVLRFERTCERGNRLPRASAARIRKDRGKNPGPPFTRVVLYGPPLREINYRLLGRVRYLGVGAWSAVEGVVPVDAVL